jgi:hypothetical protein
MVFCWILMIFMVLFPKGGIKAGTIPLTWGYLFVGFTIPLLLGVRLLALPLRLPERTLAALAILVPMQALFIYAYMVYGVADPGLAISNFLAFFFFPPVFLLLYAPFLEFVDGVQLSVALRYCILFAALWGMFLFFLHPITGHYVEIPYVTVNAADYGEIEKTKHIARGLFFKNISTYNNGNIYGVATLILLPLYNYLEHSRWRRVAIKLSLLLTLSRTVWMGLLANELLPLIGQLSWQLRTFPRIRLEKTGRRLVALAITVVLIFAALLFNHSGAGALDFLFDPTAGGRTAYILNAKPFEWLPPMGLGGFSEVVYLAVLQEFGYLGLMAFVLIMVSPLLLLLIDRTALASPTRVAAMQGLLLYAIVAVSDGGFGYIPIMAFYWFVYMIYLFGWPGERLQAESPVAQHSTLLIPHAGSPALG